ncbi:hypothetical protein HBI74_217530 [Parastagonospora nodorum]|nr:hypothetical protein HBI74_217530 [Parastagonospora nodorum]
MRILIFTPIEFIWALSTQLLTLNTCCHIRIYSSPPHQTQNTYPKLINPPLPTQPKSRFTPDSTSAHPLSTRLTPKPINPRIPIPSLFPPITVSYVHSLSRQTHSQTHLTHLPTRRFTAHPNAATRPPPKQKRTRQDSCV